MTKTMQLTKSLMMAVGDTRHRGVWFAGGCEHITCAHICMHTSLLTVIFFNGFQTFFLHEYELNLSGRGGGGLAMGG